jgi:hypothetical protein
VRYLESRLLAEAAQIDRFTLEQNQAGGSRLPESDREDMEVFLSRIRQLLPVLGSDILAPIAQPTPNAQPGGVLLCRIKGAEARGQRTANGFVVFSPLHCRSGAASVCRELSLCRSSAQETHCRRHADRERRVPDSPGTPSSPALPLLRPLSTAGAQTGL